MKLRNLLHLRYVLPSSAMDEAQAYVTGHLISLIKYNIKSSGLFTKHTSGKLIDFTVISFLFIQISTVSLHLLANFFLKQFLKKREFSIMGFFKINVMMCFEL